MARYQGAAQRLWLKRKTLQEMRVAGTGPKLYKLGPGRNACVVYRPSDLTGGSKASATGQCRSTKKTAGALSRRNAKAEEGEERDG
jgi:hypothetical protein